MRDLISSYTIYLTNNCQLRCPYCYEQKSRERWGTYTISNEELTAILDFAIDNTPNEKTIEISLFGGEPLLYYRQIDFIINYMKTNCKKPFRFFAITNGINLTAKTINLFKDTDWFILVSLDGPYEVNNHMPETVYNKIISNITSIPLEERKKHIGLKATLSDDTIGDIKSITEFLFGLETSIVYLAPTMEIDHDKIKTAIKKLSKEELLLTRDGRLLSNLRKPEPKLDLMFKKGKIFIRGGSQPLAGLSPVGWFENSSVTVSEILIKKLTDSNTFLPLGQQGLVPKSAENCDNCGLKGIICSPQIQAITEHFLQTQCIWNKAIWEELNGIS